MQNKEKKKDKEMPQQTLEILLIKVIAYLPKGIAVILGSILALVLSGDIGKDGNIKINRSVIMKFAGSIFISLYGGQAIIDYYGFQDYSAAVQGSIMLGTAVFGLLVTGILYQSIALWRGKSIGEIGSEISSAFSAIFRR